MDKLHTILLIDTFDNLERTLEVLDQMNGNYRVMSSVNENEVLDVLSSKIPDLILVSNELADKQEQAVLDTLRELVPDIPTIMLIPEHAVSAGIKKEFYKGVTNFIRRPLKTIELSITMKSALLLSAARKIRKKCRLAEEKIKIINSLSST